MAEAKEVKSKKSKVESKAAAKKATKAVKEVKVTKKTAQKAAAEPIKEVNDETVKEIHTTAGQADNEGKEVAKEKVIAKAGKRSAKAIAETEEKLAKEERKAVKAESADEADKPKIAQKPARTKLERKGKNFRKVAEQIEKDKLYSLGEALILATKTSPVKFDATVEMHVRLGVDPKQADQNIRDTIVLPAGTGKTIRVAVFADPDGVTAAKKAGADVAGSDEFLQQLDKGTINFGTLIATPAMMAKLGKYARLLGPKGLMPNPKSGTVTNDVAKAVSEAKAGRVEYRVDSTGIVHLGIGKLSFGDVKLRQNAEAVMASIKANKPSSLKGNYLKALHVTTSMGPSITVNITEL